MRNTESPKHSRALAGMEGHGVWGTAHLEAPAARRKEPSAENVREVKHWPEVRLLALRLSEDSRPPAMSLLPSMVPCTATHTPLAIGQSRALTACIAS